MAQLNGQITDRPASPQQLWGGYYNKKDETVLPPNVLTYPSINCFIPDEDIIVNRQGSLILGQAPTISTYGIKGNKEKFTNAGGDDLELRVVTDGTNDWVEVLYNNPADDVPTWYRINDDANPMPLGTHRYYFDEWFDTNLDSSQSFNLTRLIWVNGTTSVMSWTGSIATIVAVTATTLSIANGTTWASLGFQPVANGGSGYINVNGTLYQITAGWSTSTVTISGSTAGISVNDLAFDKVRTDVAETIFDYVSVNKNYAHYGTFTSKNVYISNAFNKPSTSSIITSQAIQNDMILADNMSYTGTGSHIYRVTIDSINPAIESNEQIFSGTGANTIRFNTSSYDAPNNNLNVYSVKCVAEGAFTFSGSPSIVPKLGDVLIGSSSGAQAQVAFLDSGGQDPAFILLTPQTFEIGETITGTQGTYGTTSSVVMVRWFQFFANGVAFTPVGYSAFTAYQILPTDASVDLGVDDLTIDIESVGTQANWKAGDTWTLSIQDDPGNPDTFQWQIDKGTPVATGVVITGGNQTLNDGVRIKFISDRGHAVGDFWDIQVDQSITNAWVNFYQTVPQRKPGEGAIVKLSSNFWTMKPQEKEMYVNTQNGKWGIIDFILSSDLRSEKVDYEPLKQASQNKVIFPYMIASADNYLVYVTENKTLDFIGRRELIEMPQIGNLSDPVKKDFVAASFVNGSIKYWDKKLWITSPEDPIMMCYDWIKKYWQPPQVFQEAGILSIVGDNLIAHSNIRNQTNTLFVGTNDNDTAFTTIISLPYNDYGDSWDSKIFNMDFCEGYMVGSPQITYKVLQDVGGCAGTVEHIISPKMCVPQNRASLGKGPFGSHGLGNDPTTPVNYFQEVYKHVNAPFYYAKIQLECSTKDQQWAIKSLGINATRNNVGNNKLSSNTINIQ